MRMMSIGWLMMIFHDDVDSHTEHQNDDEDEDEDEVEPICDSDPSSTTPVIQVHFVSKDKPCPTVEGVPSSAKQIFIDWQ